MAKIMTDLSLKLSANSAELKKGLDKAKGNVKSFGNKTNASTSKISRGFSNVQGKIGKAGAALGPFGGALTALASPAGIAVAAIGALVAVVKYLEGALDEYSKTVDSIKFGMSGLLEETKKVFKEQRKITRGKVYGGWKAWMQGFVSGNKELMESSKEMIESGLDKQTDLRGFKTKADWMNKFSALEKEAFELRLKGYDLATKWKKLEVERVEFQKIYRDTSRSQAEVDEAVQGYLKITNELEAERVEHTTAVLENTKSIADMTYNQEADTKEIKDLEYQIWDIKKQSNMQALRTVTYSARSALLARKEKAEQAKLLVILKEKNKVLRIERAAEPEIDTTKLASVEDILTRNSTLAYKLSDGFEGVNSVVSITGDIFAGMSDSISAALSGTENIFKSFWTFFKDFIKGMIIKLVAAAIAALALVVVLSALGVTKIPKFGEAFQAFGGIGFTKGAEGFTVPSGYPNDTFPALLTSGETVTPAGQSSFAGGNVVFRIEGRELVGILNKEVIHSASF